MNGRLYSPLVERALRLAARSHRNHVRKASDLPYISHLAGVALILAQAGFVEEEILAAALLHDAVEDTDLTVEQLVTEFPPAVVQYVAAVTERKRDSEGRKRSWEDRKQEHLAHIRHAPAEARAIVLADKLHNLSTMLYDLESGDELWTRFGATPERLLAYYGDMIDAAAQQEPRLKRLADECRSQLGKLKGMLQQGDKLTAPASDFSQSRCMETHVKDWAQKP